MKQFRAMWYDQDSVVETDSMLIDAETEEKATSIAYKRHNGNPPAPRLYLEEVKGA